MTENLSARNWISSATCQNDVTMLRPMENIDAGQIAARLRAIMAELKMTKAQDLASALGTTRSVVSNWLNKENLPPVHQATRMVALLPGLTLDYIYRGDASALPVALAIRLGALVEMGFVHAADDDPEPPPLPEAQKAKGQAKAAERRRRAQKAT